MKDCIDNLLDRGRKAMFTILTKAREQNLAPDIQIDLFHKLVLPIISYGSELWAYEDLEKVDKFHLKFLRYVLRLNTGIPIPMIYGETGEIPVSIILKSRMIGYMCKLLNPNTNTLSQQVLGLLSKMHNDGYYTTKWFYKVISLLTEMDYVDILQNMNYVPPKILSQVYKTKAKEVFVTNWRNRMSNLTKCDMYQLYKVDFEREKYLRVLQPNLAISLCKYRTSNHKLEVEKLRYVRPHIPRMDRKCTKCNLNETGNEIHHLLVCPIFEELRNRFIPNRFLTRVNLISFLNLMSNKNRRIIVNLARFIQHTMKSYS